MAEKSRDLLINAALLTGLACLLRIRFGTELGPTDDAYMTWRGACNLAEGLGFVYNPGERVLPTSTPLYAMIMAALYYCTSYLPHQTYFALAVILDAVTLVLLWDLLRRSFPGSFLAASFTLCFSLNYLWALSSIQGMESPLFLFLMIGSAWAFSRNLQLLAACFAGLVAVTRPEGLLFAALAALIIVRSPGKRAPALLVLALPLGCWLVFSQFYYGSLVPNSLLAKSRAYVRPAGSAFYWSLAYLTQSFAFAPYDWRLTVLPLAVFLAWFGLKEARHAPRPVLLLICFSAGILGAYAVFNPLMFFWYSIAMLPGLLLLIFLGFRHFERRAEGKPVLSSTFAAVFILLPCSVVFYLNTIPGKLPWLSIVTSDQALAAGDEAEIAEGTLLALGTKRREDFYRQAAAAILSMHQERATIIAPEFGALGYGNRLKLISSLAHVNPEVLPFLPVPGRYLEPGATNAISREMVEHFAPDFVVSMQNFVEVLMRDDWFAANYRLRNTYSGWFFGQAPIHVFERKQEKGAESSLGAAPDLQ